jgi:hypothetical protein
MAETEVVVVDCPKCAAHTEASLHGALRTAPLET